MSLRTIAIVFTQLNFFIALMSAGETVIAGPEDWTQSASGETQSTISLVSQKVARCSTEKGSDELRLLFSQDRDDEEFQSESMAEILREDSLPDEAADESLEIESDETRDGDQEKGDDKSVQKQSMTPGDRFTARLTSLRKPASSLTIAVAATTADKSGMREPVNRAATVLSNQPSRLIEGSFHEIVRADRVPASFCHRPTYFQELNLERGGQIDCQRCGYFQNACSSFWFLTNATLLPYRIASQSPCQCVGGYGDCRMCQSYDTPIEPLCDKMADSKNVRGTLLQAASMAGFAFLIW